MGVEEAREFVEITPKERNAVDNYINSKHTQMNALASFDVMDYIESAKKGWFLAGDGGKKMQKKLEEMY